MIAHRTAAKAALALVWGLVAFALLVAVAAHVSGCTMSPVARHALAISLVADATSGGAIAVDRAARADLHQTCPILRDHAECVDVVRARWAPVDAAIALHAANLEAWRTAVDISRAAGTPPGPNVRRALVAVAASYTALRALLATQHVDLPPLPAEAVAALAALGGQP